MQSFFKIILLYNLFIYCKIFEPYASFWIKPLLNLAVSPESGNGFHYFLRDICIVLLKWKGMLLIKYQI
jgi:hypothetical protein